MNILDANEWCPVLRRYHGRTFSLKNSPCCEGFSQLTGLPMEHDT